LMEKVVYSMKEFIKHTPVPERPSLIAALEKQGLKYYENDYSCFEGSMREGQSESVEIQVFEYLLRLFPRVVDDFARCQRGEKKLCFREAMYKYFVSYTRMSGVPWTSLANGLYNLCAVKYLCWVKDGKVGLGDSVDGFVEGDDGLFATRHELCSKDFEELGNIVKIHKLDRPQDGHFCGNCMSRDLVLMKDPRRVFRTFGWTGSYIYAGNQVMDSLLRSKALSLCYEMPNCPIVGVLAREALKKTEGVRITHEPDHYRTRPEEFEGPSGPFCPSGDTRAEFSRRYQINEETQVLVEEMIREGKMEEIQNVIPPTSFDVWYESHHLEFD